MLLKNISRSAFMAVIISVLVFSCQPLDVDPLPAYLSEADMEGMIKLGKKLENPYTVENMQKAWENLKTTGRVDTDIDITTSHLYLKFMPKTEEELDILKSDSTLILYDYPLDVEIEGEGDFYHDPSIPIDQPTYQYVGVTVDQVLPDGVEYEVLAELFVPDEYKDGETNRVAGNLSEAIVEALVNEALRITGNLEEGDNPEEGDNARITSSSWRPAGRIRVWDDQAGRTRRSRQVFDHWEYYECDDDGFLLLLKIEPIEPCRRAVYRTEYYYIDGSYVPVHGVEVRARRWITTHEDYTDSNGYYSCNGTFKNPANYSIKWERYQFSVRSGTFGQAGDNGPKKKGDWNETYGLSAVASGVVSSKQQYYALIFQAAHDYYYTGRFGLSSPPTNGLFKPQTKIAADITERQNEKPSHAAFYARAGGILPSIYIRAWKSNADYVYAVTAHELAHSAHWDMDRSAFRTLATVAYAPPYNLLTDASSEAVIESWATGVEWMFAQERYRNKFGDSDYEYRGNSSNGNYQRQTTTSRPVYTSIVVDMIDDENQRRTRTPRSGWAGILPEDNVEGYSIKQVEQSLKGSTSWNQWRNRIKSKHISNTEDNVDELFANWY